MTLSLLALALIAQAGDTPITNLHDPSEPRARARAEQVYIHRPDGDWTYSHHPSLIWHEGRYHAMWSNGRKDEDAPGQRILISSSSDFLNWSPARPLVDSMSGTHSERVLTAAGFHSHAGKLVAYFGQYEYQADIADRGERPEGDTHHQDVRLRALVSDDGESWGEILDLGLPVVPNHPPTPTRTGRLILCGHTSFPFTDDPSGLRGWRMSGIYPKEMGEGFFDDSEGFHKVQEEAGWPVGLCEGSFFQTDDGVLHMLLRSGTERLWVTESRDEGETWSAPRPTQFTDNVAKFHFGRLPDRRFHQVGNPDPQSPGRRNPLVLSLSRDGIRFDKEWVLADQPYEVKYPGMSKGGAYAYPHSIVHDKYLCVIVSVGKESVLVLRVPLESL
ncbi:MAG: exo-alpha-sialidase [Candidatus Omnitrophica bacterium]|nr:hypothetical protein [bacterium]NUN95834.1 exo-alpha-sialidase [Candidatus Omnitrophota bacterium]